MQDQDEQAHIREKYAAEQGKGAIVEQLAGERENALRLGDDSAVLRVDSQLAGLGYETPEQRGDAARARKDDAERRAREEARIVENRGAAVAHDDHEGGVAAQKAGVVDAKGNPAGGSQAEPEATGGDGGAKGKEAAGGKPAAKQPPQGRTSRRGRQEHT